MQRNNKRGPDYQKDRGERQEARILDILTEGPKTAYALAEIMHLSRFRVQRYLNRMMELPNRRAHICGFEMATNRPRFLYDAGEGKNMRVGTYWRNRLLLALEESAGPASVKQLCSRIGLRYGTSLPYVRSLRKSNRIHIAEWAWSAKTAVPLYVIGKGDDAPKPTKRPEIAPRRVATRTSVFAALGL